MPTYEYVCNACTHRFEIVQKFSDDPIKVCPSCNGAVRKVYFAAGVVFKGSGWYINDSRPTPQSDSAPAAAETVAPSDATKTDAPASTPDQTSTPAPAPTTPSPAPSAPAAKASPTPNPSP